MSPHMEETVERFVRYPNTLTPNERTEVAHLIEVDLTARRLASFYCSFYLELDAPRGHADSDDTLGAEPVWVPRA